MSVRVPSLVLVLLAGASAPAAEPKSEWVRQSVMLRTDDVKPGKLVGKELVRGDETLDANMTYTVLAVNGDFLELVGYVGRVGWVAKSDAVLRESSEAVTFFSDKIKAEPNVAKWYGRRGSAQMRGRKIQLGGKETVEMLPKSDTDPAFRDLAEAVRLDPKCTLWRRCLGVTHAKYRELDEALEQYEEVIRLAPGQADGYAGRATIWLMRQDYDRYLADVNTALRLEPRAAMGYNDRGLMFLRMGLVRTAQADFDRALELDPECGPALSNRAQVRLQLDKPGQALADLDKTLELDPTNGVMLGVRAGVLWGKKEYRRAMKDAEQHIALAPEDAEAYRRMAWCLATCVDDDIRDPKQAVELAEKAVKLAGKDATAGIYDTLAVVQAANGDFDAAVREETKAIEMLDTQNPRNLNALFDVKKRLELYKSKKPYRE